MADTQQRRLSAILVADVVGYSLRVADDEAATLAALRDVIDAVVQPALAARNGRLVKLLGDGVLAEFASVVDAVDCAVDIQTTLADTSLNPTSLQFRVGINLGDIVIEDEDVFGDGVILASRLEGLAQPGGICVSRTVANHVGTKTDVTFRPMGKKKIKNNADPVEAFEVVTGALPAATTSRSPRGTALAAIAAALLVAVAAVWWLQRPDFTPVDPAEMAAPLPDGPSIAVLPFDYLGADPEANGYLADGLSENIISTLARIPDALVIARNSTFTYRGQAVDVRDVAIRFGVRYVLEGSVQKSGDSLRVTAQLVDGVNGRHLWTEIFDRPVTDIFAVQDEITLRVARAIYYKTISGSELRNTGGTTNLAAWASFVEGTGRLSIALPEPVLQSIPYLERAIELDPNFAVPYASLAHTEFFKARYFLTDDPARTLETAAALAEKALELDPKEPSGYSALGMTRLLQHRAEEAADAVLAGAKVAPANAFAQTSAAWVLTYLGRGEEAMPYYDRAIRTYVVPPWWLFGAQSQALSDIGRHADAVQAITDMAEYLPEGPLPGGYVAMAQAYLALGQEAEARQAITKAFELEPALSIQGLRIWDTPYIDPALPEKRYERLRQLGVPETPPVAE